MNQHLKSFTQSILILGLVAPLLACQTESRSLTPGQTDFGTETQTAEPVKININPMVDILFVIDDSGSMRGHQESLVQNIDRFVEGLGQKNLIDFHIGVTSVWDSRRYGLYDPDTNKVVSEGEVPAISRDNKPLFNPIGQLFPVKAPKDKQELLQKFPATYITKGEGFVDVLKETLKIGVRDYYKKTDEKRDASGPEYEEVFSPVMAALQDPVATGWNKGFYRPEAQQLVIIMITDANDSRYSNIDADRMFKFLTQLKGKEKVTVFGVINPSDKGNRSSCPRDPAGPPRKIESLISMTQGKVLDICGNYGSQLLSVGSMIQDKTLREIEIPLSHRTVVDKISVKYGAELIQQNQTQGWTYDGESNSILIRGASKWTYQPDATIIVDYEPVDPTRRSSTCIGCIKEGKRP